MMRLNLISTNGLYHPRVFLYDGAAHMVTNCFRQPNNRLAWANITVRTSPDHKSSFYSLRKVQDVVTEEEN